LLQKSAHFLSDSNSEPVIFGASEDDTSALSRNGFRVNRRGFALIWKSDNALGTT
jgi:hypothetical protein